MPSPARTGSFRRVKEKGSCPRPSPRCTTPASMVSSRWNRTSHPWERTQVSAAPLCSARPLEPSKIYSAGRVSNGPDGEHGHRAAGPEGQMAARVRLRARKEGLRVTARACRQDVRRRTVEQGSMQDLFSLAGKVAVVTGATGVLGGEMVRSLARSEVRVAVLGRDEEKAHRVAGEIEAAGGESLALPADVLDTSQLQDARDALLERWGRVDILVNAAGGNVPEATLGNGVGVFQLPEKALRQVMDLNFLGTVLPCQIFGAAMVEGAEEPDGCIVNISSMAASKTLTNVVGYSAAKAAVDNFTRWLAVELARSYGPDLRVNAIAPGFFIGEQNRDLLLDEDSSPSQRGQTIIQHTPAGRFGEPEELGGTLIWLCSPASAFVNGIVVPVDGGFSAFSGV